MKFPGIRRAAAAIALTVAGVAGVATAGVSAAQAAPASSGIVVVSCTGRGLVRPVIYDISCSASGEHMAGMDWTTWSTTALGAGRDEIKVYGKFHGYQAHAKLWRLRARPQSPGERYYTRMKLTYTGAVPPGFHRTRIIILVNHM